jgi:hypothetical protein
MSKKNSQWEHKKHKNYFKGGYKTIKEKLDKDTGYINFDRVFTLSGMIGSKPRVFSYESPYAAKVAGWVKYK